MSIIDEVFAKVKDGWQFYRKDMNLHAQGCVTDALGLLARIERPEHDPIRVDSQGRRINYDGLLQRIARLEVKIKLRQIRALHL